MYEDFFVILPIQTEVTKYSLKNEKTEYEEKSTDSCDYVDECGFRLTSSGSSFFAILC